MMSAVLLCNYVCIYDYENRLSYYKLLYSKMICRINGIYIRIDKHNIYVYSNIIWFQFLKINVVIFKLTTSDNDLVLVLVLVKSMYKKKNYRGLLLHC